MRMLNRPNRLSRNERIGSAQTSTSVFVPLGYRLIAKPKCFFFSLSLSLSRTNQHMPQSYLKCLTPTKIKKTAHALGSCGARLRKTVPASVSALSLASRRRASVAANSLTLCAICLFSKRTWSTHRTGCVYLLKIIIHVWDFDFRKENVVWYVTLWCKR